MTAATGAATIGGTASACCCRCSVDCAACVQLKRTSPHLAHCLQCQKEINAFQRACGKVKSSDPQQAQQQAPTQQ